MEKVLTAWNLGWVPILLAHPKSVAHGLNLQMGGSNICWYTPTFDREEWEQLIRRLYRQGQTSKVFNYMLVAQKTMDVHVYNMLRKKGATQASFLVDLMMQQRR